MVDVIFELNRITQLAALVPSSQEQLIVIVDEISRCLKADVCTLYRKDELGDMQLLASHGLSTTRPVSIPKGKGLVGLVCTHRHTINLANGIRHPDYFHVKDVKEESFKSFCGAPLVLSGNVMGVLVIQKKKAKKLSGKQEAFLTTIASHIALIINQLPVNDGTDSLVSLLSGNAVSEGIGIGKPVFITDARIRDVPISYNQNSSLELEKWTLLREKVTLRLESERRVIEKSSSEEMGSMFDAYKLLLQDEALSGRVEGLIADGFSVQFAIKQAVQYFSEQFQQMEDAYLKERGEDVWHIGNMLYQTYLGGQINSEKSESEGKPIILIGNEISVSDIASYAQHSLQGLVSLSGSKLSHTSILANALGIPAVTGVNALVDREDLNLIVIDGYEGKVYLNPSREVEREYKLQLQKRDAFTKDLERYIRCPARTKDGTTVSFYANSGLMADLTPGLKNGAEGIGLFRTEIPFILRESFPTEDEQYHIYRNVFEKYGNKPVYMRTLDIGGDKQLPYFPIEGEENPALGWRGIRFSLDNIQLSMAQVRAMIRAAGQEGDLRILLPMVSSLKELDAFKLVLNDAYKQLVQEGAWVKRPKLGVMIEVPAAISQIRFWSEHIDFINIGSNDLSQYLLAVDRGNTRVASIFNHVHPAVISEIKRIVDIAHEHNLPVCVCGEMAADPIGMLFLVGIGVSRLSVSSARIPYLKALICNLDIEEAETFSLEALNHPYTEAIQQMGSDLVAELSCRLALGISSVECEVV